MLRIVRMGAAILVAGALFVAAAAGQTGVTSASAAGTAPALAPKMAEKTRRVQELIEGGLSQARSGFHARAVESFRQALNLDSKNSRAMTDLSTSLIALEKYAEAAEVLQRAIAADPLDYFAINNLAWMYATARDIRFRDGRRSVALARESLMIAPNDFHVWNTLAEGYYCAGEYAKAQRAAEESVRNARAASMPPATLQEYERQLIRCRNAAEAMDIIE